VGLVLKTGDVMKVRNGFVSNSSTSSFVIALSEVTSEQLEKVKNHIKEGKKLGIEYAELENEWNIEVSNGLVYGFTAMDNFDMLEYLEKVGVSDKVRWID
jgi:hypothetical protein